MKRNTPLPESVDPSVLDALAQFDTCTIADAIERFDVRLRNEGFTSQPSLICRYPELPPMLGYAVTLRVRGSNPPMRGNHYSYRAEWWKTLGELPKPHVVVIEDLDRPPGAGAFVGEVHAAIFQALGCVGVITSGSVRDLASVRKMNFPLFSPSVSPSHAYAHVVDAGEWVQVSGLRIRPGDLLIGDWNGIVRVPNHLAPRLIETAEKIRSEDRELIQFCSSPQFSRDRLAQFIEQHYA